MVSWVYISVGGEAFCLPYHAFASIADLVRQRKKKHFQFLATRGPAIPDDIKDDFDAHGIAISRTPPSAGVFAAVELDIKGEHVYLTFGRQQRKMLREELLTW